MALLTKRAQPSEVLPSRQVKTMRTCMILSLFLHVLALFFFQKAFPSLWPNSEGKSFCVELLRPPLGQVKVEDFPDAESAPLEKESQPSPSEDEATISLNTKDKRYVNYARLIKERLLKNWQYPPIAREQLLEGKLLLVFSLISSGKLKGIRLVKQSGHRVLDEEAVGAIRASAPFPPFPEQVKVSKLNIKAAFDYRLSSRQ